MEHDIIAYLYPHGDNTGWASEAINANPRHAPPLLQPIRGRHSRRRRRDRRERESTEPPENPGASALDYLPYLVVRLDDIPRTDKGLIFGSNPKCDVVLDYQGISNVHFSLTFDDYNRLIVKDLNSFMGTQVTYDGGGEGTRRDFQWIVGGHDIPEKMEGIVITVPDVISFQIVVPPHDIESPAYVDMVKWFKQGTATTEDLLDDLGLSNPLTRPRTGAHTPGTGEIHLRKKLGEGSFGVVTHLWNVSTGDERAVKTPSQKAIQNGPVDYSAWQQEAYIIGLVKHPHIVRLIESLFTPQLELHFEYMPYGSLDKQKDISYNEALTIVRQCSSALAYLHAMPIAHRDIKPANILVEHRFEDDISVKLADFGLSRHGVELTTLCGTGLYLAPEVHLDAQRRVRNKEKLGYTTAVDIWSLGVVAYQLIYGLPPNRTQSYGVAWCKRIINELQRNVQRQPTALGSFLMDYMVIGPPELRYSASDCCDLLGNLFQPKSHTGATTYFVRSEAPTPDSFPSSSRMTQKASEISESLSSSAVRRYTNLQGHEMTRFLNDCSADNPLYVGSSLAAQLRENNSRDWASEFLHGSSQWNQVSAAGSETGRGSGPSGSSIPQGENGGWHVASGTGAVDGGYAIGTDDYDERVQAALMLQAIGAVGT